MPPPILLTTATGFRSTRRNWKFNAGAGGVVLGNDLILYPSPLGKLQITTTDGGSVRSTPGNFINSSCPTVEAPITKPSRPGTPPRPLHLIDTDPVSLVVDGDLQNFFLRSPKRNGDHRWRQRVKFWL